MSFAIPFFCTVIFLTLVWTGLRVNVIHGDSFYFIKKLFSSKYKIGTIVWVYDGEDHTEKDVRKGIIVQIYKKTNN